MSTLSVLRLPLPLAVAGLIAAAAPLTARADLAPMRDGSCPSNYTLGSNSHGKPRCYSPTDLKHKAEAEAKKNDKGTKSSSSSSSSSSGRGYVEPTRGSVAKANPLQRCPSGYYSNQANDQCITHWDEAPASAPKRGACPAGTVEEWGAWCTASPKDTDDKTLDRLDGYKIRDFNVVYLAHQLAGKPTTSMNSAEDPEALKHAKAARVAAGNPWKEMHVRDREAAQAKQAAAKAEEGGSGSASAAGQAGGDPVASAAKDAAKDTAKEVGKALRGLLGR